MQRCTPLSHAATMLKISGQSDPDLQIFQAHTHTHTHTQIPCFYKATTCSLHFVNIKLSVAHPSQTFQLGWTVQSPPLWIPGQPAHGQKWSCKIRKALFETVTVLHGREREDKLDRLSLPTCEEWTDIIQTLIVVVNSIFTWKDC